MRNREGGSIAGTLLGILVFLAGVGLLALTFWYAYQLFGTEPGKLFNIPKDGKTPLNLNEIVAQFLRVIVQVLALLVMALIGGVTANRGIKMFSDSRWPTARRVEPVKSE